MTIFTPEIHEKISQLQEDLYNTSSISIDDFLKNAFTILNANLRDSFKAEYLFGKLYYRDNVNDIPKITSFFDNIQANSEKSNFFSEGIKRLEKQVEDGLSKSLSVVITERFLRGIVLFKGVPPVEIPSIVTQDFDKDTEFEFINKLNFYKQVMYSEFGQNDEDGIKQLYEGHKMMAKYSQLSSVYSYLIRTRTFGKEFNGVLYLVLQRGLKTSEYSDIADLLTFILEIFNKIKNRPKVQQEEWQTLFYLQSHVAQHELNIVQNSIHEMDAYQYQDDKFELYKERATKNIDELFLRNKMILYMTWYGSLDEDQKGTIISKLKNEKNEKFGKISVKATLLECIETIRLSLNLIIPRHEKIKKIETECIPTLLKCIDSLPDYEVDVMETALKVLFIERLKNAFYHTCDTNPVVTIKIDTKASEIHFTNNKTMDHDAFNEFKNHKFRNIAANEKRNAAGEKLQRFILASPFFSQSANWSIHPTADSIDLNKKLTDIYFSIKPNTQP